MKFQPFSTNHWWRELVENRQEQLSQMQLASCDTACVSQSKWSCWQQIMAGESERLLQKNVSSQCETAWK